MRDEISYNPGNLFYLGYFAFLTTNNLIKKEEVMEKFTFNQTSVSQEFTNLFGEFLTNKYNNSAIMGMAIDGESRHRQRVNALKIWALAVGSTEAIVLLGLEGVLSFQTNKSERIQVMAPDYLYSAGAEGFSPFSEIPRRQQKGGGAWNWAFIDAFLEIMEDDNLYLPFPSRNTEEFFIIKNRNHWYPCPNDKKLRVMIYLFLLGQDAVWADHVYKRPSRFWRPLLQETLEKLQYLYNSPLLSPHAYMRKVGMEKIGIIQVYDNIKEHPAEYLSPPSIIYSVTNSSEKQEFATIEGLKMYSPPGDYIFFYLVEEDIWWRAIKEKVYGMCYIYWWDFFHQ